MKKTKAQITLFIILGLVIFILIFFSIYLMSYKAKEQTKKETKKIQKIKTELQPIEDYVTQCLDQTVKDAVFFLGKQGGYLFNSQGGPLVDFLNSDEGLFFVNYDGYKVAYGITPLNRQTGQFFSKSPSYPWVTFPEKESTDFFEGLFGQSNLPPINRTFGTNSVKSQLEFFIKKNMEKCVDWTIFEDQGYEIEEQEMNIDLTIAKEDFTARLDYPISIIHSSKEESTSLNEFVVKTDIRLQHVYNLVKNLIEQDIHNIKFDIETENLGNDVSIEVVRDVFEKDDIIIVKDMKSLIHEHPFEFVFSRRNRIPALHYITPLQVILDNRHEILDTDLIPGGLAALKATDPDEDVVSFSIDPAVPKTLNLPDIEFKILVSDGELQDYQVIKVLRSEDI